MAQAAAAGIEYTIYTYDMPSPAKKGDQTWKKHATITSMEQAIKEAGNLHETRQFHKIEVKKKFFDQKKNRTIDMTLKVYETQPKKDYSTIIAIGVIAMGGVGAFLASYLLTGG